MGRRKKKKKRGGALGCFVVARAQCFVASAFSLPSVRQLIMSRSLVALNSQANHRKSKQQHIPWRASRAAPPLFGVFVRVSGCGKACCNSRREAAREASTAGEKKTVGGGKRIKGGTRGTRGTKRRRRGCGQSVTGQGD